VEGAVKKKSGRLSYHDQREFDAIEATIEAAEQTKAALERRLAEPGAATNSALLVTLSAELDAAGREVERLYARWQDLQSLAER
jgi:ATP-binding cassette subfamily F protein uup